MIDELGERRLRNRHDMSDVDLPEARARLVAIVLEHGGPRTDRHGSGCVSCGLVWPCPTFRMATGESRG